MNGPIIATACLMKPERRATPNSHFSIARKTQRTRFPISALTSRPFTQFGTLALICPAVKLIRSRRITTVIADSTLTHYSNRIRLWLPIIKSSRYTRENLTVLEKMIHLIIGRWFISAKMTSNTRTKRKRQRNITQCAEVLASGRSLWAILTLRITSKHYLMSSSQIEL